MNTFNIKEKISNKGNRIVCIHQNACESNPKDFDFQWLKPNDLFKTIIKIKTIADQIKYEMYMEMTIEEVFNIAVKNQDWNIIPYTPVMIVIQPAIFVLNTFNEDIDSVQRFFEENPSGIFLTRDSLSKFTKNEFYTKLNN